MAVSNWWTVNDALMQITGGPYRWDGTSAWTPPSGDRAINTDPTVQGYTWPPNIADLSPAALSARIAALEARLATEARGVLVWPGVSLALGGTSTQRVKLKTVMPSTAYTASAFLIGGTLLGNLTVQSAVVVDRQNVDVTIKATLALTVAGISVLVFADS